MGFDCKTINWILYMFFCSVNVHTILEKSGQLCGVLFVTMIIRLAAWFEEIFLLFFCYFSTTICRGIIFLHMYNLWYSQGMMYKHGFGAQQRSPFSITLCIFFFSLFSFPFLLHIFCYGIAFSYACFRL
jgi:hypothetical protein